MSSISKILKSTRVISNLCNRFSSLNVNNGLSGNNNTILLQNNTTCLINQINQFSITTVKYDLMEFFDDKKNWGENEVKVGRSWTKDELRIKSNTDLHKLWYVLLKEKNMLLTMQHEYYDQMEYFPSPERIDKVEISMENLEEVVRERNRAYYLLETGETGERPRKLVSNKFGVKYMYKSCEHVLPVFMNLKWYKSREIGYGGYAVRKFLRLYREKLYNEKRKARNREKNHVIGLLRRNPELNIDKLKEKYPSVDIDKLLKEDKCRGHYVPKV